MIYLVSTNPFFASDSETSKGCCRHVFRVLKILRRFMDGLPLRAGLWSGVCLRVENDPHLKDRLPGAQAYSEPGDRSRAFTRRHCHRHRHRHRPRRLRSLLLLASLKASSARKLVYQRPRTRPESVECTNLLLLILALCTCVTSNWTLEDLQDFFVSDLIVSHILSQVRLWWRGEHRQPILGQCCGELALAPNGN